MRTRDGGVVELRNLVKIETGAAPSAITRLDRQRSVTVSGNLEGKKLGTAVAEAREIAAEILPEGVTLALSGQAEAFQEGVADFGLALLLAVLVIYMVLAAQFESLTHPLTVMMALPLALVGAFGGLFLMRMTLNLFSLIGMILLMGLVTKNSILLIDYAEPAAQRGHGQGRGDAARGADPHAAGADDGDLDDLRRAAGRARRRPRRRDARADGRRRGRRDALLDGAHAARRARLLPGSRRRRRRRPAPPAPSAGPRRSRRVTPLPRARTAGPERAALAY